MTELTERLLADAGGWQVMKQARALHELGRVLESSYNDPLLEGRVRVGQTEFRAGLRILSKSNVENLCTCRPSRQHGTICEHSLAVGLTVLKPRPAAIDPPAVPVAMLLPERPRPWGFSTEGEGSPFELAIILPPNLAAMWERNSVTVGLEAQLDNRTVPLSSLDTVKAYRCSPADFALMERVHELADGQLPAMMMLSREELAGLFTMLAGHRRVSFGKKSAAHFGTDGIRPPLRVERTPDGAVRLQAALPSDGKPFLTPGGSWLLRGETFVPVAAGLPSAYHEILIRQITIPAAAAAQFNERELPVLAQFFEIDPALLTSVPSAKPALSGEPPAFIFKLEGSLNFLEGELECERGERRITVGGAGYRPGAPEEQGAIDRLRLCGFTGPNAKGKFELKGEPAILSFFARHLPQLEREWSVTIGARFQHVTRDVERIEPRIEIRASGENWFDLQFDLATPGGERFSASEIQRLLQSGRSSVRRPNGKLAVFDPGLLDEFEQVLKDCNPQQRQPGQYRIGSEHAAYLDNVATQSHLQVQSPPEWRQWATAPRELDRLRPIPLGDLEDVLRPYQKQGVYWLNFLAKNGWGGILADEMGLGKTVQMLAFLRTLKGRTLVVCPSSLIYNWMREAARFAPELRTLAIEGPKRQSLFSQINTADLVITSYPLLRRDAESYRGIPFKAMVLDEAQHIKNPESQNAQSAQSVQAEHRFVLTGTPVENSVRDIWSIMNFLMPGYLGSRTDFKERFEGPIQNAPGGSGGGGEQRRLSQRLKPFMLRRLKRNVAPELPEKLEQVSYCELTAAQRETYTKLLASTRQQVAELASTKDQNKARILMLTALLRLRQACCDLRLLGLPEVDPAEASAKLELLDELLQEALDGGHRVIVFSQFVTMLHLIRDQLTAAETPFCYLDGSTRNRQVVVDEFQKGETPVFLMSLKAGGVGLNLTAADTVIHFDPWWNPAVEAQATDRAHRIGQKNVVTSYKLIARNTVEEKILALQGRKREMIEATIESEQPLMEGLTSADIEALLL